MIIGSVCNPKPDQELVVRKLKQYADEMASSAGYSQPSAPEYQKPVETKKSEDKKDKSKDKNKK